MPSCPRRLLLPRMVLCAVLGVGAMRAPAADGDGGTPIGVDDFTPEARSAQPAPAPRASGNPTVAEPAPSLDYATPPGVVRTQPVAYAPAAAGSQAAFRAPLPGQLATDGDIVYVVGDPPTSGVYRHPAGLFVLRFPSAWRVMRSANGGEVIYTFSAEAGRVPPKQIRTGAVLVTGVMGDLFRRQRLSATAALQLILPAILQGEPGMKVTSPVAAARLGGLEAATCTLRGTRKDVAGEFVLEYFMTLKDGMAFQLRGVAPAADYAAFRPVLLRIAADSAFGRAGRDRLDQSLEARRIVQQYKASVVSISAPVEGGMASGSGFIISRDGYVLTNYHVAFDTRTGAPMKELYVEWDESLRRPKVPARLIGGSWRMGAYRRQHGIDVALLKIPPGDYEPMPLSPLAEVEAGDGVVTLGFPSRGMLEGVSLTVTTGVVTRFNRGPQGDIVSTYVDAAFTHGSSGGPCVSLVTGGVVGLNSFGTDVQLDPRAAHLNDLIKYFGVVPIDAAIREFPLVCLPGLSPELGGLDFFDCLDLSKYFLGVGSFAAAEQLALRAVSLEPRQALARMRLGECRFEMAKDRESEGDRAKAQTLVTAARAAYDEALARDPKRAAALAAYARLELQQNRLPEAAALAARAAAADPEDWQGNLLLADVCHAQGRLDEALRCVDQAQAVAGGALLGAHETAAWIHTARKDFESARREWAEAVRISPVYLTARLGVAAYYEQVGQTDAAVAEYRRVLDDFPENGEVLGRIGLCLQGANRTAEAADYFAQSIRRCQAASQAPDESVLMFFGDLLMQQPDSVAAVPTFATYLYHYPQGQFAAVANLKLAAIHAEPRHGAAGLAGAHARRAAQVSRDAGVAQAAAQYGAAPLALAEIQAMAGVLQYPPDLAAAIIADSTLGFAIDETQLMQLQQQGMPEQILRAIIESLSRIPPMVGPAQGGMGPVMPGPATPGGADPGGAWAPPGGAPFGPPAPAPPGGGPDLRGTWVANGITNQQVPFRSVMIFGDLGLFTSDTWIGTQSLGLMRGTYRFENGRLILQPEGGPPFAPNFQMEGDSIVMDVANFAPGLRFMRDRNAGVFR